MMRRRGVTIIEMLITITVIAVGIFPLLGSLAALVDHLLLQQDKINAITVGRNQMDLFLNQYQLIDTLMPPGFSQYPVSFTLVAPGPRNRALLPDNAQSMDYSLNGAFYRTFSTFQQIPDLTSSSTVTYRIEMEVWKVGAPLPKEVTEDIPPAFKDGDALHFRLNALYTQANRFEL